MPLLVIDAGNTNTKWGVWEDGRLVHFWTLATNKIQTPEQLQEDLEALFSASRFNYHRLKGVSISSVVPAALPVIESVCVGFLGLAPFVVRPGIKGWPQVEYDNPLEIGTDRVTAAVAALHLYGAPLIVVGLGTATTFEVIDEDGRHHGGLILPGAQISAEAMTERAALLPNVIDVRRPEKVVGQSTVACIQSGVYYGAVGQVDGVVQRIKKEYGLPFQVVATGGLSEVVAQDSDTIEIVNKRLLMEGLRILWEQNCSDL